ncbi:hypothetical protein RN001_006600 [Aquatica leii]|uniref:Uncharacterized protein n=1 Tax=Aquatica leii TaxID=1421715 RepID=A0AAN7PLA7_9COLE|nr:hypothetical protein RN001_006600 [Aquatica leii]
MREITRIIPPKFISSEYIRILEHVLLPTVRTIYPEEEMDNIVLAQDNYSIRTDRMDNEWFDDHPEIQLLPWPAKSCYEGSEEQIEKKAEYTETLNNENVDVGNQDLGSDRTQSDDTEASADLEKVDVKKYVYCKYRIKWALEPPTKSVKTPQHNIIIKLPTLRLRKAAATYRTDKVGLKDTDAEKENRSN